LNTVGIIIYIFVAYTQDLTKNRDEYYANSHKNILSLVWRVDMNSSEDIFEPSWPLLMTTRDITFTNRDPMEIGLQYSWKYWDAALLLRKNEEKNE
jgi:hypothetical protein